MNLIKSIILFVMASIYTIVPMKVSENAKVSEIYDETFPTVYARYAVCLGIDDRGSVMFDDMENIFGVFPNEVVRLNDKIFYHLFNTSVMEGEIVTLYMTTNHTPANYYDDEVFYIEHGENPNGLAVSYTDYGDFENLHLSGIN